MSLSRRDAIKLAAAAPALAAAPAPIVERLAPPGLIASPHARQRVDLTGEWHWIADPFDTAVRKPRDRRRVWDDAVADAQGRSASGTILEYEWDTSPTLNVPGDWNTQLAELGLYDGPLFLRRRFAAKPSPGWRQWLHFEAVNRHATVWLNGVEVGRHEGGFTPFFLEVTGRLRADNSLVVRVDSRHGPATLPSVDFDWLNYGGITRPVWLMEAPRTFIRDWFARLQGERIVVDVALEGPEAGGLPVWVGIGGRDLDGETDASGHVRLTGPARGLALWSPERPILHNLVIDAGEGMEVVEDRVGLRTLATRGRELLLNGRPVRLDGISLHEERFGAAGGRPRTESEGRALLQAAKDLGCNFVRLAHYPHAEPMARIADELGLLVWAEIPVYWEDIDYRSPHTLAAARTMMAELVTRDRNRACVALWSVANETPRTPDRTRFLETVIADVRALDPTRLVTAALDKNADIGGVAGGETRIRVDDPLGASLDVLGVNQYEAWYSKRTPVDLAQLRFETPYDKPLIFSEFGADALRGHRGPPEERWTEDYQAALFEETLKLVRRTPGCVGCAPWVLKDFRSPRRWHGRFQRGWNRKGVLDETGREKLAAAVLRRWYRG